MKNENKARKRAAEICLRAMQNGALRAESEDERRILEGIPVLIAEYPDSEEPEGKGKSLAALKGGASRDIEELARQIHRCCSDKKWTSYQKRVASEQLVNLAFLSTNSIYRLAKEFPEPFREIAEELPAFPCLFPAHADDLRSLQKTVWDEFNLGKRHMLKLRAAPGRKTFSTKTWVNSLLLRLIDLVYESARYEDELDPGWDYGLDTFREVAYHVPLTPENAKQWLDVIWKLLLAGIPNPETHPRLGRLGKHPSRTDRAHFGKRKTTRSIKDALGEYAKHQTTGYIRVAIKEALGKYLVRMLRKEQPDK